MHKNRQSVWMPPYLDCQFPHLRHSPFLCWMCFLPQPSQLVPNNAGLHSIVMNTHTHTWLTALFPGLPRWVATRKVKPMWILLKQETVSGSGISWSICKSARCSRQITTPAPHHSVFYRPDALPAAQPTASKHWRQSIVMKGAGYVVKS